MLMIQELLQAPNVTKTHNNIMCTTSVTCAIDQFHTSFKVFKLHILDICTTFRSMQIHDGVEEQFDRHLIKYVFDYG